MIKKILKYILLAVIVLVCWVYLPQIWMPRENVYLPDNYEGFVAIVYEHPSGKLVKPVNRSITFVIPDSGILYLKNELNTNWKIQKFFMVDNAGNKKEVRYYSFEPYDDSTSYVFDNVIYSPTWYLNKREKSILYEVFYVGTRYEQKESKARWFFERRVDDMLKNDTAF